MKHSREPVTKSQQPLSCCAQASRSTTSTKSLRLPNTASSSPRIQPLVPRSVLRQRVECAPVSLTNRESSTIGPTFVAIQGLFRTATKQRPNGMPFVIFIDVNLPSSPGVPFDRKPWLVDVRRALGTEPTINDPDPFTMLFVTNFAVHFGAVDEEAPSGEWTVVVPRLSEEPFRDASLPKLMIESVRRYSRIPDEI